MIEHFLDVNVINKWLGMKVAEGENILPLLTLQACKDCEPEHLDELRKIQNVSAMNVNILGEIVKKAQQLQQMNDHIAKNAGEILVILERPL